MLSRGGKGHLQPSSCHGNSQGGPGRECVQPRGPDLFVGVRFELKLGKNIGKGFPLDQPLGVSGLAEGRERESEN